MKLSAVWTGARPSGKTEGGARLARSRTRRPGTRGRGRPALRCVREDVRGRSGGRGRTGRGRVPSSSPMLAAAPLLAAGIIKERPLCGSALPLAHRGT